MTEEELPLLPKELERYMGKPYGGLFGDSVNAHVVEQVVADPYSEYRPKLLQELAGASAPAIRRALADLTRLGLLTKDSSDRQHPVYRVNPGSRKLVALTFLAYASVDDRDGTDCMDFAIMEYVRMRLGEKLQPSAVATETSYPQIAAAAVPARRQKKRQGHQKSGKTIVSAEA
jgi:hypothetical protein